MHGSGEVKIDAKEYVRIGEQYAKAFREMFPVIPVVVSTTCARCHATLPEMTEATVDAVVAAHQERCFVVGDWVRGEWNNGWPVSLTGEVAMQPDVSGEKLGISVRIAESTVFVAGAVCHFLVKPGDIRRIPRPGQVDPTTGIRMPQNAAEWSAVMGEAGISASGPIQYQSTVVGWTRVVGDFIQQWQPNASYPSAPRQPNVVEQLVESQVLYDGMTAMDCYMKWSDNRAIVERGGLPLWDLTTAQIDAGRVAYQKDALNEHADELRSKVAASAEAERLTVLVDLDDPEGEPW